MNKPNTVHAPVAALAEKTCTNCDAKPVVWGAMLFGKQGVIYDISLCLDCTKGTHESTGDAIA